VTATKRVLITGAGGFIGHHFAGCLVAQGHWVRGVDIKEPEFGATAAQEFEVLDLLRRDNCVRAVCGIAGKSLRRRHDLTKPQGVHGRNSDNSRLRAVLGWEPRVPLEEGMAQTYRWIEGQLRAQGRTGARARDAALA
jgi:nucleoside-diphosphate-sugar epimerase